MVNMKLQSEACLACLAQRLEKQRETAFLSKTKKKKEEEITVVLHIKDVTMPGQK